MALSFNPASLMAPGGIVSGLDDIGAAVIRALDRRAERRYAGEREARQRGYSLEDRNFAKQLADERLRIDALGRAADAYGPDMDERGLTSDIDTAGLPPDLAEAFIRRRLAAKGAYDLARQKSAGGGFQPVIPPPTRDVKRAAVDPETGLPTGDDEIVTEPAPLNSRVAAAETAANVLAKTKGRSGDAARQREYAAGGRRALRFIDEFAVPWQGDTSPIEQTAALGVQLFDQGEIMPPEVQEDAIARESAAYDVGPSHLGKRLAELAPTASPEQLAALEQTILAAPEAGRGILMELEHARRPKPPVAPERVPWSWTLQRSGADDARTLGDVTSLRWLFD